VLKNGGSPASELWKICTAIAGACLERRGEQTMPSSGVAIPKGLEDKAEILGALNARLIRQAQFIDLALRSVEDGLLIASADGAIRFANRSAAAILQSTPQALTGRNLFDRLSEWTTGDVRGSAETLARLLVDRAHIEQEVATRAARPRHFALRIAPVEAGSGTVVGLVASLADITRQKELQQTQKDVMSLVSHEMRTPLTAIQGMSELLANYDVQPERRRELNSAINDEVKRLSKMITQYLDITRLESGASQPRFTPVRLEQLAERVLLLLEPVAAARQIRLVRVFAPDIPPVIADAELLSRAAENLVSNAIKYSPAGTTVHVAVQHAPPGQIELEVADQGYGIPAQDRERIFEKFYRVPRPQDAGVPGTGLGLALVREIMELHGGSVRVASEVNGGSTFTLTLPVNAKGERAPVID
jgi:PAS domain S-box-containing protein